MAEKGYPRVTAREVAERAGVMPALVNYYFGNKQGLLRAVVVEVASEGLERIQQASRSGGNAHERVQGLIESWIAGFKDDPYFPRLAAEQILFAEDDVIETFVEQFGRPNLAAIQTVLQEGFEAGEFRRVDPMYFVPALAGMCLWFFLAAPVVRRMFDLREITPEHTEEFTRAVSQLVLHGITEPHARSGVEELGNVSRASFRAGGDSRTNTPGRPSESC